MTVTHAITERGVERVGSDPHCYREGWREVGSDPHCYREGWREVGSDPHCYRAGRERLAVTHTVTGLAVYNVYATEWGGRG